MTSAWPEQTTPSEPLAPRGPKSSVNDPAQSDLPGTVWLEDRSVPAHEISVHGGHYLPSDAFECELASYVLILYVGGRGRIRRVIGGIEETREVGPGHLSIHPPFLASRWTWDVPIDVLTINVGPGFLRQVALEELEAGPGMTLSIPPKLGINDSVLVQLGVDLAEELTPPQSIGAGRCARAIGERIAVHLLRHYALLRTGAEVARKFTPDEVAALRAFVAERLADDVRVAEMANVVSLSEHHFFRVFRETFGKTPSEYLQSQRLELARYLVMTTSKSIAEIATLTGFSDQSHLARCFRRRFNAAPSRLRVIQRDKS